MTARAAAVMIVLALSMAACSQEPLEEVAPLSRGDDDSSSATSTGDDGTPIAVTTTTIAAGTPLAEVALDVAEWPAPTVELLERGAEPHREVRFTPQEGAQMHLRTWSSYEYRASAQGFDERVVVPSIEIDHTATVAAIDGDRFVVDDHFLDYRLPDAGSMDRVSTVYIRSDLNRELGTTERVMLTSSGAIINAGRLSPGGSLMEGVDPDQSFPLPDEPFGVGARWRITNSVIWDELPLDADGTVVVTEIHDDRVVAQFENRLAPPADHVADPGVEFLSGDFSATGTITWVLWAGVVLTDEVTTSTFVLRETTSGRDVTITVDQRVASRTTPRDPAQ